MIWSCYECRFDLFHLQINSAFLAVPIWIPLKWNTMHVTSSVIQFPVIHFDEPLIPPIIFYLFVMGDLVYVNLHKISPYWPKWMVWLPISYDAMTALYWTKYNEPTCFIRLGIQTTCNKRSCYLRLLRQLKFIL